MGVGYSGSFYIAAVADWEGAKERERVRCWGWGDA